MTGMDKLPAATPVLLVDDDPDFCDALTAVLSEDGYEVTKASNGDAAMEAMRRQIPVVVLLDWNMPQTDGMLFLKQLRADAAFGGIYVIMVTARSEASDVVESMEAGADDYLTKPFDNEELLARVRVGVRARNLQRELVGTVRRSTVLEMAGSIAHEIGNPLTAAKLLQERLRRNPRLQQDQEILRELDELGEELGRIEALVRKAQSVTAIRSVPYAGDMNIIDLDPGEQ